MVKTRNPLTSEPPTRCPRICTPAPGGRSTVRGAATGYREEWASIQQRFVDQPAEAVQQADRLVVRMMRDSGYPVDEFEQRVEDISVDHPDVAQHYREAHAVAVAQDRGTADTEQLRQAATSYRSLVERAVARQRNTRRLTAVRFHERREHPHDHTGQPVLRIA